MNLIKRYKLAIGLMIYLLGVIFYCLYTYYVTRDNIMDNIDAQLLHAAKAVPFIIGVNFHDKVEDKNSVSRQEYIEKVMLLSRYCNDIGLEYIYTYFKDGDKIVFTTSSAMLKELAEKNYGEFFEFYPEANKNDFAAFHSSKPIYFLGSDKWGEFRTVLVRNFSPNGNVYVAGADMRTKDVAIRTRISLVFATTSALFFLALALPGIFQFYNKARQREIMTRFLPKEMVEDIEAGRLTLESGGVERHVTVLLTDIRGFTALSEQLSASELVDLLNKYLSCMTDIVFTYHGTLDKFLGDGVMAIFGSPVTRPDDAHRALQAARNMLESIGTLNAKLTQHNLPEISIGIALNSGLVVAGNIGSPKRLDYTVIGNVVNMTARVEELNKELKTCLLLTESTYQYVANQIDADVVTERMVKGCSKPIKVYGVRNLSCTGSV